MSEVAQMKQQIEMECESMRLAIMGFRVTASHDIINHQYEQLGEHYQRLGKLIGERQAIEVLIATLDLAIDHKKSM